VYQIKGTVDIVFFVLLAKQFETSRILSILRNSKLEKRFSNLLFIPNEDYKTIVLNEQWFK
jgi:hypothetical protein